MDLEVQAAVNALGFLEGDVYEKEPDCLETIKDLIRYLRRDAPTSFYSIRRFIFTSNIIEKDLVPILRSFPDDALLFDATLRLLLNLTQPISVKQLLAASSDGDPKKCVSLAMELVAGLKNSKRAFVDDRLLKIITDKLKNLLTLDWEHRQEEDRLMIERLLTLLRNILHISPPDADLINCSSTVHDEIILGLHKAGFDALLLDLACSESERDYHVYVLEIVTLFLREHAPEVLTSTDAERTFEDRQREQQQLAREAAKKMAQQRRCSTRHTNFAGSYVVQARKALNEKKDLVATRPVLKEEDLSLDHRKRRRKIPKNRAPAPDAAGDFNASKGSRSSLQVRMVLKEFSQRFVDAAYNKFVRAAQFFLERRRDNETAITDCRTRFWWLIRYFTAFARLTKGTKWNRVQETLSVQYFHQAQTQLDNCIAMAKIDKGEERVWARKAHIILKAYGEFLMMMQHMERSEEHSAVDTAMELKRTIFHVMEYRELIIVLFKKYSAIFFTKSYLKDLVEITHVYLKMLQTYSMVHGDDLVVQKKTKKRKKRSTKAKKIENEDEENKLGPDGLTDEDRRAKREDIWQGIADELSSFLRESDVEERLPQDVIPFDPVAEHGFDEKVVAQVRIQNALKDKDAPKAIALLRASRELWPDAQDNFGSHEFFGPEDEFLVLRNVYFSELPSIPGENQITTDSTPEVEQENENGENIFDDEVDGEEDSGDEQSQCITKEVQFHFDEYLVRFAHSDILSLYVSLLNDIGSNTAHLNHCITKMLHRVAYDLKEAPMLYQASLFRAVQKFKKVPGYENLPGVEEFLTFMKHLLAGFFASARKDKRIFVEALFWKTAREVYDINYGYGSYDNKRTKKSKSKNEKIDDKQGSCSPKEKMRPSDEADTSGGLFDEQVEGSHQQESAVSKKQKKPRKKRDTAKTIKSKSPKRSKTKHNRTTSPSHQEDNISESPAEKVPAASFNEQRGKSTKRKSASKSQEHKKNARTIFDSSGSDRSSSPMAIPEDDMDEISGYVPEIQEAHVSEGKSDGSDIVVSRKKRARILSDDEDD